MFFQQKKGDQAQFALVILLGISLVVIVVALVMKLEGLKQEERISLEQMVQQYWLEQSDDLRAESNPDEQPPKLFSGGAGPEHELPSHNNTNTNDNANSKSEDSINTIDEKNKQPALTETKIDINSATAEQLQQLKGIGPSKAKAIVADRELKGKFNRIEDIQRVKGIGEKVYASIKESIVANP